MHRWTTQLIPPELMGAHIASGQLAHHRAGATTCRFRAGHGGLRPPRHRVGPRHRRREAELAELAAWIAFYKDAPRPAARRGPGPDRLPRRQPDAARRGRRRTDAAAIYSFASVSRSEVVPLGGVRLPGLDPDRRYRVVPVEDLLPRSGRVPRWLGTADSLVEEVHALPPGTRPTLQPDGELGVEPSGATLAHAGLMPASINPDHAVLYLVTAVD